MRRTMIGWTMTLALALGVPTFAAVAPAVAKTAKSSADKSASSDMSKDDADKVKEHNKLRGQIAKLKYPAAKADIVSHVKGIKADDKKWFTETLPDKTYSSADEVYQALGWPTGEEAPSGGAK